MSSITPLRSLLSSPQAEQAPKRNRKIAEDPSMLLRQCEITLQIFGKNTKAPVMAQIIENWRPFCSLSLMFPISFSLHTELEELTAMGDFDSGIAAKLQESFSNFVITYLKEYSFFQYLNFIVKSGDIFDKSTLHFFSKKYAKRCKPLADLFFKQLITFVAKLKTKADQDQMKVANKLVSQLMSHIYLLADLCPEETHTGVWESIHGKVSGVTKTTSQFRCDGAKMIPDRVLTLAPVSDFDEDKQLAIQGFNFFERLNRARPFLNEKHLQLIEQFKAAYLKDDIVQCQLAQKSFTEELIVIGKQVLSSKEFDMQNEDEVFEVYSEFGFRVFLVGEFHHFLSVCESNLENKIQKNHPFYLTQEQIVSRCETLAKKLPKNFSLSNVNSFKGKKKFFTNFETRLKKWHKSQSLQEFLPKLLYHTVTLDQPNQAKIHATRYALVTKDETGIPLVEKIAQLMTQGCQDLENMTDLFMAKVRSELKKVSKNEFKTKKAEIILHWKELSFPVVDKVLTQYYLLRLCNIERLQGKSVSQISAMQIEEDERLSGLIRYLSFPEQLQKVKYQDLHTPAQKKQKSRKVETVKDKQVPNESIPVQEKTDAKKEPKIALNRTEDGTYKLKAPIREYPETPAKATTREEESKQSEESKTSSDKSFNSDLEREELIQKIKQAHKFRNLMGLLRELGYKDVIEGSSHTLVHIGNEKFPIPRHHGSHSISSGVRHSLARSLEKDNKK
jgi:hypothetical protein